MLTGHLEQTSLPVPVVLFTFRFLAAQLFVLLLDGMTAPPIRHRLTLLDTPHITLPCFTLHFYNGVYAENLEHSRHVFYPSYNIPSTDERGNNSVFDWSVFACEQQHVSNTFTTYVSSYLTSRLHVIVYRAKSRTSM